MKLPYELFFFGVSFFGFMAAVSAVQDRRTKEKTYYLSAVVGLVMLLAFVFAFFSQLILALIAMVVTGILSMAGLPKMLRVQKRELAKQLQEADFSSPLRVRDFFTTKWWLKLTSK
jgi:predicted MFS family arabinose efflux permease